MSNKMLIDASHPEETRVVVKRGSSVEEFDFESAHHAQLRGNIYLARVTRVEPSLQAAFVDYGGNRHGFLAFSEIHPDYYQIPVADREALLAEQASFAKIDADEEDAEAEKAVRKSNKAQSADAASEDSSNDDAENQEDADDTSDDAADDSAEDAVEDNGNADVAEEVPQKKARQPRRNYKIQEVIKRRQIILVQIVKEERGNKGAALTTYMSIAGRYSVLMPNTARGGGISRKITNVVDRKRLKAVAQELEVPQGMGLILRTAGANRTKVEIKRDFEHLLRLWENVRTLTLQSSAPKLVYEEGSLVKRAIRDLYSRDIDEVLVAGEEGYKEAKGFMRLLMPSHAKNVKPYRDQLPLFTAHRVEDQLDAMFIPQVSLKSGGYLVINQTEALVSVDVNSGKATREHSIEETAYKTNLEAARELARQLKLRDMAGLIVVDFIDMEDKKHIREVERTMKEALKNDRARIQVGRISSFGLLEMSRQRLRSGVVEGSTDVCSHCHGTGIVRSIPSVALHVLRAIEESFVGGVARNLTVRTSTEAALYILNHKHRYLMELEDYYGVTIIVGADNSLGRTLFAIDKGEASTKKIEPRIYPAEEPEDDYPEEEDEFDAEIEVDAAEDAEPAQDKPAASSDEDGGQKRKRRRRRGRGRGANAERGENDAENGSDDEGEAQGQTAATDANEAIENTTSASEGETAATGDDEESGERRRRRRGRRGGARRRRGQGDAPENAAENATENTPATADAASETAAVSQGTEAVASEAKAEPSAVDAPNALTTPETEEKPKPARRSRAKTAKATDGEAVAKPKRTPRTPKAAAATAETTGTNAEKAAEPVKVEPQKVEAEKPVEAAKAEPSASSTSEPKQEASPEPEAPSRKGWWNRNVFK